MVETTKSQFANDSISVDLMLSNDSPRVGESIQLTLKVSITDGDYIYAYVPSGKPYLQTSIETHLTEGITPASDWVIPKGEFTINDPDILIHQGTVEFTHELNITTLADKPSIKVQFKFQCCNAMSCTMPVICELEHPIHIQ